MSLSFTKPQVGSVVRKLSETPEELIQNYVDFVKSQTVQGSGQPGGARFLMTQHIPAEYGRGVTEKQPEIIYSWGTFHLVGTHSLGGWATRQSSNNGFLPSTAGIFVQLDPPGTLTATGSKPMDLTLHHDVLVGSTPSFVESTFDGLVATVMLWAIPAVAVR